MALPRTGDVLHLTESASVQFAGGRAILFRVIRVHDWLTSTGWVWLDGYELNTAGDAVERRTLFVQVDGLRMARPHVPKARNAGPQHAMKGGVPVQRRPPVRVR